MQILLFGLLALAGDLALADTIPFVSDATWKVYDSDPASGSANFLGFAQLGCPTNPQNCFPSLASQIAASIPGASSLWAPGITTATTPADLQQFFFSKQFTLTGGVFSGTVLMSADDLIELRVNGTIVGSRGSITDFNAAAANQSSLGSPFDITSFLRVGTNTITFRGQNGPASFAGGCAQSGCTYGQNGAGVVFGGSITTSVLTAPPAVSSLCSPNNPARISGSTGAQGVLDPANTIAADQPEGGLIWPATAVGAGIFLDTGQVFFTDANNQLVGVATLPGVTQFPAFPDGKLNFSRVRVSAGKFVTIAANAVPEAAFTAFLGVPPPALVLSCSDVILEADSALAVGVGVTGAPFFIATDAPSIFPGAFPGGGGGATNFPAAGFGPRESGRPARGSLYPPLGGTGGASGTTGILCGSLSCPSGGFGGGALVVSATQKITVNGVILAQGTGGSPLSSGAQGGGGGSVRLAAVLVEGAGAIDTTAGTDASGSKLSPDGPIEIQAFVQDLFAGTTTTNPIRGKPVVTPLPLNLPQITVVGVRIGLLDFCSFECSNTGSLVVPDLELSEATTVQVVDVEVETQGVPDGTSLVFRAVGTNGSSAEDTGIVDCAEGCFAVAQLSLNPGGVYQITIAPAATFPLAGVRPPAALLGTEVHVAGVREKVEEKSSPREAEVERWARAFGVEAPTQQRLAQVTEMAAVGQEHRE